VRGELAPAQDDGTLFLTHTGETLGRYHLTQLVRGYIDAAKIGKRGSCHLFRHTMATLMLENGADIRFIQAMLGHADMKTTQIYTQVSIVKLKEIHTLTHPARLERVKSAQTGADDANPQADADDPAAALLAALEAEAEEENQDNPTDTTAKESPCPGHAAT
jgi:integrase/recombinase XerD